jgi:histidyl-tRNA synthetase
MADRIRAVKGTRVLFPAETAIWNSVEAVARSIFGNYGFGEIRTPVLEHTELFVRSVGEATDIVGKEMFSFEDRKGRSLSLRPEGTAPVVRAFVDAGLANGPLPLRLYYIGPYFRYERPQKGRYRQFFQIGAEILGDPGPLSDAELIAMLMRFLGALGHHDLEVRLNTVGDTDSRSNYRAALRTYLEPYRAELSPDSQRRLETNPLRILDSKSESDQRILAEAPSLEQHLTDSSRQHYDTVVKTLDRLGVRVVHSPQLVRGLDYYTHTVFEIVSTGLGAQDAIVGGGRYDDLVSELGGPSLPAIGFAIGQDRLIETLPAGFAGRFAERTRTIVIPIGRKAASAALALGEELRSGGVGVVVERPEKGLKKSLRYADRTDMRIAVLLGEDEIEQGTVTVRDLSSGDQKSVPKGNLIDLLRSER